MIRFLFWNVCGVASTKEKSDKNPSVLTSDARYRRIEWVLKVLTRREHLDVLVLAESPFESNLAISGFTAARTSLAPNRKTRTRLEVYHRGTVALTELQAAGRAVIFDMTVTALGEKMLLAAAHLDSALYLTPETRKRKIEEFAADIRSEESRAGHQKTILAGDLNFDPHDEPITSAYGLNAVASKVVARRGSRRILRSEFPYFYNPMWGHLSDITGPHPGTYYRESPDVDCRFWYLPDQVLIRPDLLDQWKDTDLRILSGTGKINLLDAAGHPSRNQFSDHLPLTFALRLG